MIAPILDEIAKDYEGKLTVAKLNIDENPATPTTLWRSWHTYPYVICRWGSRRNQGWCLNKVTASCFY